MAVLGQGFGCPGLLPIRLRCTSSHLHSGIYFKDVLHVMPDLKQSSWPASTIPSTAVYAEPDSRFVYLCFSSSRLRAFTNEKLLFPPLQAATLQFSQTPISPKLSDSTLRMSNANPDIEGSGMPEQYKPSNPSKSKSSLARFKALQPAGIKAFPQSTQKRQLKRYVTLAKQLAAEGHMLEFAAFLQMLADAGLDKESFTSKLDSAQVDAGLTLLLSRKKLDTFVSVMQNLTKAGYTAWQFAGKRSREILSDELLLLLEIGRTEYCVKIVESLSECGFLTKKLIDPARVIASCAKSWNLSLAYRFVKLLSRKPWHYNLMIREFSYNHQLQSSFDVLDIMREFGVAPDLHTYRALIDSCGRCNEPSKAGVVFETMLKDGFKPNVFVYNSLMNVSVGDLNEVHRYYQHMQGAGITGNLASFNILLKAYAVGGRGDLAADLYFRIQQTDELNLDVVSYNTVINVFGSAKMWEEALRVKADMFEAGVTPNVVTWTSIIEACATAGLVERVFQEFDEMLNAGCCPNVNCYNALLQACVMAGHNERAFQLFEEWKQTGQIRPFSDLLNHPDPLCRTHELIAVSDIFPRPSPSWIGYIDEENWDSLRLSRCKPNSLTYNWMMKACGAAPERVKSLMREMQAFNLVPDVKSWSILLGAYGSNGDLEGCLDTLEEMKRVRFKPDVVAYTILIKVCVLSGESDMAFEIFQEMKAAGVRPNAVTYNTLIRGHRSHSQLFQVQRALAIYEEMREAGHTLNDFTLQGLIKEWGEGLSDGRPSSDVDSEKGFLEYTEALVQKVAVHARDDNDNSIVDLHGLSKGEARTSVLAVLRTIKERFLLGNPVTEDLVINTGIGHHSEYKGVSILRDVVLGVVQKELGLCVESVLPDIPGQASSSQLGSSESSDGSSSRLPRTPVRPQRPVNLGRLKVTKESLNAWLGRKSQTVTD